MVPGTSARDARYRPDIDGLRAIAVLLVVIFHAFPKLLPGGFIGVDIFFVISGFLITRLILSEQSTESFSLFSFYRRRARRILPALSVVMLATLIVGWVILLPIPYERLAKEAIAGALFVPNLLFWSLVSYFDTTAISKPLLHLWSLGVEEQFYLVWPGLLIVLHRLRVPKLPILLLITAASFAYSAAIAFSDTSAAFYSPLSRLWELGAGALLAFRPFKFGLLISIAGLLAIGGGAVFLTDTMPFPGTLALVPVVGTAILITAPFSILCWRPLVNAGLISYSLYLWHWPLLSFAATAGFDSATQRLCLMVISVFLAWLTTKFIEQPIRFGRLRAYGAALSSSILAGGSIVAIAIIISQGIALRFPPEIRPVVATMHYPFQEPARLGRCWFAADISFDKYLPECRIGDTLAWGDSYSALLATGLRRPYAQFSRDSCLPLITDAKDTCASSNHAILAEVLSRPPKRAILYGAWNTPTSRREADSPLLAALSGTIRQLREANVEVILIGPTPHWDPTLPEFVFREWQATGHLPDRKTVNIDDLHATDDVFRAIASREHASFHSIADILCNDDGCLTHTDQSRTELLAWDHSHFTIEGARFLIDRFGLNNSPRPQK